MIDDRQTAMRIDISVAMAREVFGGRDHALALQTLYKCDSILGDLLRVLAKAAYIDDGIGSVVIDVDDRCKDVLDAYRTCFAAGDNTHSPCEIRIAGCSDSHRPWKVDRVLVTHADTRLGIERDEQRDLGVLLHPVDKNCRLIDRGSEQDNPADLVFNHLSLDVPEQGTVLVCEFRIDADIDHLTDLFLNRHLFELFVGILPGFLD